MESDDESFKAVLMERHNLANATLPAKQRKKFTWTPANKAQFEKMREARARNIRMRALAGSNDLKPDPGATAPGEPFPFESEKKSNIQISQEPQTEIPVEVKEVKEEKEAAPIIVEPTTKSTKASKRFLDDSDDEFDTDYQAYQKIVKQRRKLKRLLADDSEEEYIIPKKNSNKGRKTVFKEETFTDEEDFNLDIYNSPTPTIPKPPSAPIATRHRSNYLFC